MTRPFSLLRHKGAAVRRLLESPAKTHIESDVITLFIEVLHDGSCGEKSSFLRYESCEIHACIFILYCEAAYRRDTP